MNGQPLRALVTTSEAARRLGVSRERVRQLLEHGMFASYRIEGRFPGHFVDLGGERGENDGALVTIQEAAQRFGVSTPTIRAWIEKGRLQGFRLEGHRRVYVALD